MSAFILTAKKYNLPCNDSEVNRWHLHDKQYWTSYSKGEIQVPYDKSDDRFIPYVRGLRFYNFYEGKINLSTAMEMNAFYIKSLNECITEISGAASIIRWLSKAYKIVVSTNGPTDIAYKKLQKIGVLDMIHCFFSADLTKNRVMKNNKIYYDELMEKLNESNRSKFLIIGDTLEYDIHGGIVAGIDTCWFNPSHLSPSPETLPTYEIHALSELEDLLPTSLWPIPHQI